MKPCPRCSNQINEDSASCPSCGWKDYVTPQQQRDTFARTADEQQALQRANERAKEYCEQLGLKTPQDCRNWLRKNAGKRFDLNLPEKLVQREPGEDWDEDEPITAPQPQGEVK